MDDKISAAIVLIGLLALILVQNLSADRSEYYDIRGVVLSVNSSELILNETQDHILVSEETTILRLNLTAYRKNPELENAPVDPLPLSLIQPGDAVDIRCARLSPCQATFIQVEPYR